MTRLGYFLNLLLTGFISVTCTLQGEPSKAVELVGILSGINVAGKVFQKRIEENAPKPNYPQE